MPPDFSLDLAKERHQPEIQRQDEGEVGVFMPSASCLFCFILGRGCISPWPHFQASSYFQEQLHCSLSHPFRSGGDNGSPHF